MNHPSIILIASVCLCLLGCSDTQLTAPELDEVNAQSAKKGGKPGGGGGPGDPANVNWAFAVADKQISLVDTPAGQNLTLTRGKLNRYEPTFTTDGRNVAYLRNIEKGKIWNELRIVGASGDNDRLLYSFESFAASAPASPPDLYEGMDWLPDSHKLLFGSGDLAVFDTTSSSIQLLGLPVPIAGASPGPDMDPSFGFQGPVAFSSWDPQYDWSIYVVMVEEAAGGGEMSVELQSMVRLDSSPIAAAFPAFSPDGSRIVFTDESFFRGGEGLYVVDFDTTSFAFGPQPPLNISSRQVHGPASWAPDGSWIVFHGVPQGGGAMDLYLASPNGFGDSIVTDGAVGGDMWPGSPDWNPRWCNEIDDPQACGL